MTEKGIPVSRWIDGVLEDKNNIAQRDNLTRPWCSGAMRRTARPAAPEMKEAMEKLDLMVIIDPYPTVSCRHA